jgi:phosphopantothenoylcysteine decarboxylase/phosphopantothenate--cysteine ligase
MNKTPTVVLGVTGSIAAYKSLELTRLLRKKGCDVIVIMTGNACHLVGPASFEALSGNPVALELFPKSKPQDLEHISLAQRADVLAIVPASANFIAKAANGIADDLLTTVTLTVTCPILMAPAMNVNMWENGIVKDNVRTLKKAGWNVIDPESGRLACGTTGTGRLAEIAKIEEGILNLLGWKNDFLGISILITAGRTEEPWDPVRYLSNRSSGKMGMALAKAAVNRGAKVTLISGPADVSAPAVFRYIQVTTAAEMDRAVQNELSENSALIMAAAVADYTPQKPSSVKIKKKGAEKLTLELKRNPDILKNASQKKKKGMILVGFSLETNDLISNAVKKMKDKGLDLIIANSNKTISCDNIQATIIDKKGKGVRLPDMPKDKLANLILDRLIKHIS